jgi:Ni,Fe-hydrogenase III small subunit
VVPVDLTIPGCPPRPIEILQGLVALIEAAAGSDTARPR